MTVLGMEVETEEIISLGKDARSRGTYVIGSTGTGKTTLLKSMAYQDMISGDGLAVLDPHGDLIDWLLTRIPASRVEDVILFDPYDIEFPFGVNILECDREQPVEVRWVVSTVMGTLERLFAHSWGPRLEHVLSHTLWSAMAIPDSTLIEVLLLLTNEEYRNLEVRSLDGELLINFWRDLPRSHRQRHEMLSSTINKLTPFLLDRSMRNIVGQAKSTLDIRSIMDKKKILLVNLSKGKLGEKNSSLLGSVLTNLILIAALRRVDIPAEERIPFHLIVDEYQNFASESFSVLQSEARKYAVDLVVAHQFRDQLSDENRGSALNVGNFVCFRVIGVDGPELAGQFDNTPPPPDPIWEPIRKPSETWPGMYERGSAEIPTPGPQRLYSDVMMQTGNELANLIPFRAKLKLIGMDDESERLVLEEHEIDIYNPNDFDNNVPYYGIDDATSAERIRNQSQSMAKHRAIVEEEISVRTGGAADIDVKTHEKL